MDGVIVMAYGYPERVFKTVLEAMTYVEKTFEVDERDSIEYSSFVYGEKIE